jgi:two-component system cell cycle response regulator DivK
LPTWMVVEDEPEIYELLLAMFEVWGIEGVAFVDGMEATSWIQDVDRGVVTDELPQLAIIDIRLPDISGTQVGEYLRQSSRLGHLPIVLITAFALDADEERAAILQAGADMLIYKPLPEVSKLRQMLDQIIAARKEKVAAAGRAAIDAAQAAVPVVSASVQPAPPARARTSRSSRTTRASRAIPSTPSSSSPASSSRQAQPKTDPPRPEPPLTGRADP